jgi:tetratricopeptide (TPR) repeat protein
MVIFRNPTRLAVPIPSRTLIGFFIILISLSTYAQDAHFGLDSLNMDCGSLHNHYGPWDYTNPVHFRDRLPIVENAHFDNNVESLEEGLTAKLPGGDLDYTLRAFPNHHRALYSMARYSLQYGNRRIPPGANYSGYCYFVRAIRFKPEDPTVRLIFGIYLSMQKKYSEAIEQTKAAISLEPNSAEAHYNLGLLYEKTDALEMAVQHARIAYDLGYPLEGLKNKLRRRGVWDVQ